MQRLRFIRSAGALGLSLLLPPHAASAATMPRLEADALGGTHVVLPTDAGGKPLLLMLAFTRESEHDLQQWSRALLDDRALANAAVYVVIVADKTAFVSRRHIRSLVAGAAVGTPDQLEKNVLLTFDGTGWRDLTPPGDKKTAGIVIASGNGTIVYAKREAYSPSAVRDVEMTLKGVHLP